MLIYIILVILLMEGMGAVLFYRLFRRLEARVGYIEQMLKEMLKRKRG